MLHPPASETLAADIEPPTELTRDPFGPSSASSVLSVVERSSVGADGSAEARRSTYKYPIVFHNEAHPPSKIMSSLVHEVNLLRQVARDLQTSRYMTVASFVVLFWDILITLSDEVTLIWKAKWSMGKTLYLACRYPILMEAVVWLTYTLDFSASSAFCSIASYLNGWSTLVFLIPVQCIVVLRTFALWERRRIIVATLILVTLATDIVMAVSIGLVSKSLVFKLDPLIQPVFGCDSGLVSLDTKLTIPAWAALMGFDTVIFILTLVKVAGKFRHGRSTLLTVLVRDGFAYYTVMLATSVANLVIYTALPDSRRGLLNSMLQVLRSTMSIVGARILLNVRGVISDSQGGTMIQDSQLLSLSHAPRPTTNTPSEGTVSVEMNSVPPMLVTGHSNA